MPQLVIKSHRPWQLATAIVALSMVISLVTWLLLDSSHWKMIYDRLSGNLNTKSLLESNQALTRGNRELRDRVLMLEQTTRLDKETAVLMQEELKLLQDEIYGLKRELEFYQGVMDSARKVTNLDIHGLFVEPLARKNQYRIKLVLTHVAKSDMVIKGRLDIHLEGLDNGNKIKLDLNSVSIEEKTNLAFELKNFKRVEYQFELPPDFSVERVMVQVIPIDGSEAGFSRVFDWPINIESSI